MKQVIMQRFGDAESRERKLLGYLLKLLLIWLSWKLIIFILGEQKLPVQDRIFPAVSAAWEAFNLAHVNFLINTGKAILQWMGYNAYAMDRTLWIDYVPGVTVGNYCLGIQLMYYFALLVLITPMSPAKKLAGVLSGIVITVALNIIRITGLVLISYHAPQHLYLAHDHLFNILVFGILLILFYFLSKHERRRTAEQST